MTKTPVCEKHGRPKQPGLTSFHCEDCLRELAQAPLASRFLLGKTLEETYEKLQGAVELNDHLFRRGIKSPRRSP